MSNVLEDDFVRIILYRIGSIIPDGTLSEHLNQYSEPVHDKFKDILPSTFTTMAHMMPIYSHNPSRPLLVPSTLVWEFILDGKPYKIYTSKELDDLENLLKFLTTKDPSMIEGNYLNYRVL